MAEAVVDERAPMPTRFYCHMCSMEINIPNTDFICPHCAGGFVEELPALPTPGASGSSSASSISDGGTTGPEVLGLNRLADLEAIRGELTTLLMSRNGPIEISFDRGGNRRGNMAFGVGGGGGTGTSSNTGSGSNIAGSSATGGGRVRSANLDRLDNVLFDFLQSLSTGDVDTFGNSQMFFMGNPGDYAWGREGIDTIVTQLLNQMETSGPPPLAKEKIAEIPKVEVTGDDVDRKLQCSVCWEDFRLQEPVRKLPCSHIYHENCIVPWLNLHGTCPICRKSLTDEEDAEIGGGAGIDVNTGGIIDTGGISSAPRVTSPSVSGTGAASATGAVANGTAGGASQAQNQQRNHIFAFEDGNVDLD